MTAAKIDQLFGEVKTWLPDFIARAADIQSRKSILVPRAPLPLPSKKNWAWR